MDALLREVTYPARFIQARFDTRDRKAIGWTDTVTVANETEMAARLRALRAFNEDCAAHRGPTYELTLAAEAEADAILSERLAWLEMEHGQARFTLDWWGACRDAYGLAVQTFSGRNDTAALSELPAALYLAICQRWATDPAEVTGAPSFIFRGTDQEPPARANGHCSCQSAGATPTWCKHRLARAIARRAEALLAEKKTGNADTSPDN